MWGMELISSTYFVSKIIFGLLILLWLVSLRIKNSSIVDIFWGMGFVVAAWGTQLFSGIYTERSVLLLILVSLWGARLSGYLAWRNWGKPEDYRYQAMREKMGNSFCWVSLFSVFLLQGALIVVISIPVQATILSGSPIGMVDILGALVTTTGIFFESLADYQLASFKKDPKNQGQVLDRGLWRYTRHPNYFGDFLVWWGFYLIALTSGAWWVFFSPLIMSFLLMKVSGVPLLESALAKRTQGYQDYIRRTSRFFPRPPKQI